MTQRIALTTGAVLGAIALAVTLPLSGVLAGAAVGHGRASEKTMSHTPSERQKLIATCRGAAKGAVLLTVKDLKTGTVYACWGAHNPANWRG